MSHHGLQVLYTLMNDRDDWACERAFTPWPDMEARAAPRTACRSTAWRRSRRWPSSTSLGFTLQYEICYEQHADDARPGRHSAARAPSARMADPLVIAGGPCCAEPRAARAVHRCVRHRRRRAEPAGDLRLWLRAARRRAASRRLADGEAGRDSAKSARPAGARVAVRLRAAVLRAGVLRRRPLRGAQPHAAATCRRRSSRR